MRLTVLFLCVSLIAVSVSGLAFGVIGDWGLGGWKVAWTPEILCVNQYNEFCAFVGCNFTISTGDNIYCGDVHRCIRDSFEELHTSPIPILLSVGNHDNAGAQISYRSKRWWFPHRAYNVKFPIDDTGYTVEIFAVDTTDGGLGGGGQYAWLTQQLEKSNARWKFIFGHYPTVGSGRHRRVGTVSRIHDIMSRYNVQAFFCGHDHIVEISNIGGRLHGLSGGISRGGMMYRGIGGGLRRFTLTSPGEYNKFAQDWPTHGFLIGDLSPNVLNLQLIDGNGGVVYDLSLPWDWLANIGTVGSAKQHHWPPPDTVLKSYRDEVNLPLGCGGGVIIQDALQIPRPSSIPEQPGCKGTTPTMPVSRPGVTTAPVAETTPVPAAAYTPQPEAAVLVDKSVKYSVATECNPCGGEPTIDVPFTVFISGKSVDTSCRVFLSQTPTGCQDLTKPQRVDGTAIVSPGSNAVSFTAKGLSTTAYVCFSADKGKSYFRLPKSGSLFSSDEFIIKPPIGYVETEAPAPATLAPVGATAGATQATTTAAVAPPAGGGSGGGSSSALLSGVVAALCGAAGAIGATYFMNVMKK